MDVMDTAGRIRSYAAYLEEIHDAPGALVARSIASKMEADAKGLQEFLARKAMEAVVFPHGLSSEENERFKSFCDLLKAGKSVGDKPT